MLAVRHLIEGLRIAHRHLVARHGAAETTGPWLIHPVTVGDNAVEHLCRADELDQRKPGFGTATRIVAP